MKNKRIYIWVLTLMTMTSIFGQQDAQYTQYMYNMNILNPAYAGSKGITSLGILGRTQWVELEGSPQTATLSLHSPVGRAVGLGLSVIHDEVGPVKENNTFVDFSYTINTSEKGSLAFGLKGGISFLDVGNLESLEPDPLNTPIHMKTPNFGVGVYYYTNKFYLGMSAPNILETRHLEKEGGIVSTASEKMHYFITSGYVFELTENLKLKPSTMIKATSGAPLSVDLSANLLVADRIELGLSYRFDDSISGILGFNVNEDFRIGYAYDHTTTKFGNFNKGSHEIMMLFDFNRRNLKSPRFF